MDVNAIQIPSGGTELLSVCYSVDDPQPPTAILLHGIPGSEKNWDIAYRLRDLGWQVVIPSFRGSWGSGGDYDITTQPDDASATIAYVTKAWSPRRIALIGYSLGSRAAFIAASRDPRVNAVVSISGVADFDDVMPSEPMFNALPSLLAGVTSAQLKAQYLRLGGDLNPVAIVPRLTQPLLIVHGTADETVPYYMAPALHAASEKKAAFVTIDGADHTYTRHRARLVTTVTEWLTALTY